MLPADGASRALGASGPLGADPELTAALVGAGATVATVVSTDLFFDPRPGEAAELGGAGRRRGGDGGRERAPGGIDAGRSVRPASSRVTDVPSDDGSARVGQEELERLGERLGAAGYEALRSR